MQEVRKGQDPREKGNFNSIVDLTEVGLAGTRLPPNTPKYICEFCDCGLIEKKDDTTYLGYLNNRWICPKCGQIKDEDGYNPDKSRDLKRSEEPRPVVGYSPYSSNITPVASVVVTEHDKPRGTLMARQAEKVFEKDPEPREEDYLRAQGYQIKKTTLELPGSGQRVSKIYD
jgi:hypothetical protein